MFRMEGFANAAPVAVDAAVDPLAEKDTELVAKFVLRAEELLARYVTPLGSTYKPPAAPL
jgi:hypothetical protein